MKRRLLACGIAVLVALGVTMAPATVTETSAKGVIQNVRSSATQATADISKGVVQNIR